MCFAKGPTHIGHILGMVYTIDEKRNGNSKMETNCHRSLCDQYFIDYVNNTVRFILIFFLLKAKDIR